MNVSELRHDFPILSREVHGKPLVYLDSAATSQKPEQVIDAMSDYYRLHNANVHRGIHALSEEATLAYEAARQKVAAFVGAVQPEEVVFTKNTTEAINLVAHSFTSSDLKAGDEILLTVMEHHSNLVPWQLAASRHGLQLKFVPVDDHGRLRLNVFEELLSPRTRLVALTHVSNVLGTVNPVQQVAELAHARDVPVLVDGAQSVPHFPVDVQKLGVDFLAFSGHKMLGPTGIGVLYGRRDWLERLGPFLSGGDMIRRVELDKSSWNDLPYKFEAGTPPIAEAIGLGAAVDYLSEVGMQNVWQHEQELTRYAYQVLSDVEGLSIYGPGPGERGGVITFNIEGIHPHDLASILDREGVAIRAGHHCAQPLMGHLETVATARASFYLYNLPAEVNALVGALHQAKKVFAV